MPKKKIEKTNDDYQYVFNFIGDPDETLNFAGKDVAVYFPEKVKIEKGIGHKDGLKSMSIRGRSFRGRFRIRLMRSSALRHLKKPSQSTVCRRSSTLTRAASLPRRLSPPRSTVMVY